MRACVRACAQASDVLAELVRKQEAAAARQAAEGGGAAGAKTGGRGSPLPPLGDLFAVGQLVRCVVARLQDRDGEGAPHMSIVVFDDGEL